MQRTVKCHAQAVIKVNCEPFLQPKAQSLTSLNMSTWLIPTWWWSVTFWRVSRRSWGLCISVPSPWLLRGRPPLIDSRWDLMRTHGQTEGGEAVQSNIFTDITCALHQNTEWKLRPNWYMFAHATSWYWPITDVSLLAYIFTDMQWYFNCLLRAEKIIGLAI